MHRIFLLSPAYCGGQRCQWLLRPDPVFQLAQDLHTTQGVPLGDLFSFVSGLYFRGKLAYSRAFANPPPGVPGTIIITPNRGFLTPETPVRIDDLREFASVEIGPSEDRFQAPFVRSAEELSGQVSGSCEIVLLGSIASSKYVETLASIFSDRLRFPAEFAGRGDMSRGGLLLRCVDERRELVYVDLAEGRRHGPRPPRLVRKTLYEP